MDVTFLAMAATVGTALVVGWKRLPAKLAPVHQSFREAGISSVYRDDDGRLTDTGITIHASAIKFDGTATFVLMTPVMRSNGSVVIDGQAELRIKAVTRWPSMKSVLVLEEAN